MIAQLLIGAAHDLVGIDVRLEDEHRVNALGCRSGGGSADDCGFPNAGLRVQRLLDVLGKHVQPFGRDDHLLLAAAYAQLSAAVDLADVTRVEPAILERRARFLRGR